MKPYYSSLRPPLLPTLRFPYSCCSSPAGAPGALCPLVRGINPLSPPEFGSWNWIYNARGGENPELRFGRPPKDKDHEESTSSVDGSSPHGKRSIQADDQNLTKLKCFLATLRKLGSDLSPAIGVLVESLIRALVVKEISAEEFHERLLKETNFPLKPLSVPFLKSSLPTLQQQMSRMAEISQVSTREFLLLKPEMMFVDDGGGQRHVDDVEASRFSVTSSDCDSSLRKRRMNEFDGEIDLERSPDARQTAKRFRFRTLSTTLGHSVENCGQKNSDEDSSHPTVVKSVDGTVDRNALKLTEDRNTVRSITKRLEKERILQRTQNRQTSSGSSGHGNSSHQATNSSDINSEDWTYVENTLRDIVDLVEQCRQTINVLQDRPTMGGKSLLSASKKVFKNFNKSSSLIASTSSASSSSSSSSHPASISISSQDDFAKISTRIANADDGDGQQMSNEAGIVDCKSSAVTELCRAIAVAKTKVHNVLDCLHLEITLDDEEATDGKTTEVGSAEHPTRQPDQCCEKCWSCGRSARDTCSGCNEARYCGVVCQHRHWKIHQRSCSKSRPPPQRTNDVVGEPGGGRPSPAKISDAASQGAASSAPNADENSTRFTKEQRNAVGDGK